MKLNKQTNRERKAENEMNDNNSKITSMYAIRNENESDPNKRQLDNCKSWNNCCRCCSYSH